MSIRGMMKVSISIQHRDPDSDTFSDTGEIETVAYGTATVVKGYPQPTTPAQAQQDWGLQITGGTVLFVMGSVDVRPAVDDSNGLGDKVTIDSKVYQAVGAQDLAGRKRIQAVDLERME